MAYFSSTAVRILQALTNNVESDALAVESDRHKAVTWLPTRTCLDYSLHSEIHLKKEASVRQPVSRARFEPGTPECYTQEATFRPSSSYFPLAC
jgi:hypothetical protein